MGNGQLSFAVPAVQPLTRPAGPARSVHGSPFTLASIPFGVIGCGGPEMAHGGGFGAGGRRAPPGAAAPPPTTLTFPCEYIIKDSEMGWRKHLCKHALVISRERQVGVRIRWRC